MEDQIRKPLVEAISHCNLACKMCFRHRWIGERFGDLDPAVFTRVMDSPALSGHKKRNSRLTDRFNLLFHLWHICINLIQ